MNDLNIKKQTKKLTMMAILCALAVSLSALEMMMPSVAFLPPGFKLGLSNIITMFTCCTIGVGPAIIITVVKSLFVVVNRGMIAFVMSFCGGVFSTITMGLFFKCFFKRLGFVGISIIAALVHNVVQGIVACLITSTAIFYYAPFLVLFALITGSLTGIVLKLVLPVLIKLNLT